MCFLLPTLSQHWQFQIRKLQDEDKNHKDPFPLQQGYLSVVWLLNNELF